MSGGIVKERRRGSHAGMWTRVLRDEATGCWVFMGAISNMGYGQVRKDGRLWLAHRLAYTELVGPIPDGLTLDHLCRNTRCCNPAHLEAVTHRENCLRGTSQWAINAARTHCPQGHEYTPDNLMKRNRPGRECRLCNRDRKRATR